MHINIWNITSMYLVFLGAWCLKYLGMHDKDFFIIIYMFRDANVYMAKMEVLESLKIEYNRNPQPHNQELINVAILSCINVQTVTKSILCDFYLISLLLMFIFKTANLVFIHCQILFFQIFTTNSRHFSICLILNWSNSWS